MLLSRKGKVVRAGEQGCYLNWSVGWAVEEGPSMYSHRMIFLFSAEAKVLTGGRRAGLCFLEKQTVILLHNCVYSMFPAMLPKEISRIPTQIMHRRGG